MAEIVNTVSISVEEAYVLERNEDHGEAEVVLSLVMQPEDAIRLEELVQLRGGNGPSIGITFVRNEPV